MQSNHFNRDAGSITSHSICPAREQGRARSPCPTSQRAHHVPTYEPPAEQGTQSPDRPPRRRAANGAKYDLEAAWLPLNEYMTASESSSGSIDDDDGHGKDPAGPRPRPSLPPPKRRRVRRPDRNVASGSDSDSDAYRDEPEDPPQKKRPRKPRSSVDTSGRHKAMRRKTTKPRNRTGHARAVSKAQMRALLVFMLEETDWARAAAAAVAATAATATAIAPADGQVKREREQGSEPAIAREAARLAVEEGGDDAKRRWACRLRAHWRDEVVDGVAEMYA